jgi:hypothetical protein
MRSGFPQVYGWSIGGETHSLKGNGVLGVENIGAGVAKTVRCVMSDQELRICLTTCPCTSVRRKSRPAWR